MSTRQTVQVTCVIESLNEDGIHEKKPVVLDVGFSANSFPTLRDFTKLVDIELQSNYPSAYRSTSMNYTESSDLTYDVTSQREWKKYVQKKWKELDLHLGTEATHVDLLASRQTWLSDKSKANPLTTQGPCGWDAMMQMIQRKSRRNGDTDPNNLVQSEAIENWSFQPTPGNWASFPKDRLWTRLAMLAEKQEKPLVVVPNWKNKPEIIVNKPEIIVETQETPGCGGKDIGITVLVVIVILLILYICYSRVKDGTQSQDGNQGDQFQEGSGAERYSNLFIGLGLPTVCAIVGVLLRLNNRSKSPASSNIEFKDLREVFTQSV